MSKSVLISAPLKSDKEKLKEKKVAQARKAISTIFSELSIVKIVYVDDRCSIQELKEGFIGKIKALYSTKPPEIDFVNWDSTRAVFDKHINSIWEDANEEIKRSLFLRLLVFEKNIEDLENSIAPLKLKESLKDKIELYSPTSWLTRKDEILAELKEDTKILFLFDIDFTYAPLTDGRNGTDLAVELLSDPTINKYVYCGIFSHLFSIDQEYEKRNELCASHGLKREKFYTVSKKRFQDESYLPGLVEGIRNTLLINEVECLKRETSIITKKSFLKSQKELDDLNPDSFNQIIQKSSQDEGIWEMSTLLRLSSIITSHESLKSLLSKSKRTRINTCLEKIRRVEKVVTGSETPINITQIQSLREKEIYIQSEIINQLHSPISNGDMFFINDKEYILLAQPCNLLLRRKGTRDRGYDFGFLLELEEVSTDKFHGFSNVQLATLALIENTYLPSQDFKIARFSTFKPVSLIPLDLTVFNTDGKATIYLNKPKIEYMTIQESWKKRYETLYKEFLEYKEVVTTFKKLKSENKDCLKKLIYNGGIFKGYNIINENILKGSSNILDFNIRRTLHYKEPYSTDLLQKFMHYLSRNAFDHDFSHVENNIVN